MLLLWVLLVLLLVRGVVLIVKMASRPRRGITARYQTSQPPLPWPQGLSQPVVDDPALSALRVRYGNGEISREEYLQSSADLGHPPAVTDVPPLPN